MNQIAHPRIPISTYRLQLNRFCTFRDVSKLVSYLHALGITDLYCSPYFTAVPGSLHGYDVVDPTTLNPEIGTEDDYRAMTMALHERDMGQLLDVVPNHMGIALQINGWWQDVLENGPSSPYASFFDIDWDPLKTELRDKVLLPILGDHYGVVLENQELQLEYENGRFLVRYYEHTLPIAPKPSALILAHRLGTLREEVGEGSAQIMELESIITALKHLPSRQEQEPEKVAERYREKEIVRRRLVALVEGSPVIRQFLEENVRLINGAKSDPQSFDLLDEILNDQAYRLAYWRVAAEEVNYRRFFDINELAAIRTEDPTVFEETHKLLFRLVKEGAVTGLRIDHVDGLYDPAGYLNKLQAWAGRELSTSPDATERRLYIVVEKILGVTEGLPTNWPVYGTTGYDFLSLLNAVFIERANERLFDNIYERFAPNGESFAELTYRCKQLIMQASMASELSVLGHQLNQLSERDRRSRDFTLNSLTHAIQEIIACFPVYRTYITGEPDGILGRDRTFIWQAVTKAKRRNPAVSGLVFDFVRDLLLNSSNVGKPHHDERLRFVGKFQQTTSPVTAKGIEDTAFYRYNRFVSLNEVGSDPQHFGLTPSQFHQQMESRQEHWPVSFSATSTHDTKRGEDVRARLNVLSELPKEWKNHVLRWKKLNRASKTKIDGEPVPSSNEEYLLYQTLLGAWPLNLMNEENYARFAERIQAYMNKAVREAKAHSSWVSPDLQYEEGVRQFVASLLDRSRANGFWEDFLAFQERIAQYGLYNSISQLLVKIAAPGVPDFYQGTELWDFSLVDPDNRQPVDFSARIELLGELQKATETGSNRLALVQKLMSQRADGHIKLFLTMEALRYRRGNGPLFQRGDYVPLEGVGDKADHVLAFARTHGGKTMVTVVPRFLTRVIPDAHTPPLGEAVWQDTWLTFRGQREYAAFQNVFTGARLTIVRRNDRQMLPVGEIFRDLPAVWLEQAT